ncbi:MAG TPA: ATP-binding protein [Chitinophagaceae bacterium]|nr:ATP-binding protein [Chitinophagaceae bacterium]
MQSFFHTSVIIIFQDSLILLIYAYYIITSWKILKGAQWAIVAGVLLAVSFGVLLAASSSLNLEINDSLLFLYTSGLFLSTPLSLLIYVAIRFREIIKEVQQNAKQVVQLSEEKKEQAIRQQKILQEEVNRQTAEIRTTLDNLKTTQSQLIQSEKMASLGELTAGIAHEIQNPLNFVNNFSEVSNELLDEMKTKLDDGNTEEAKSLADDVKQNLEKILHHGKRADAIVKGMLQHSRSSSGQKESTDINTLADEYLRLAYHGLRAKDKSFNAAMKTDYDESIGLIKVMPQDMGRVILNLITNAFYAVTERKKLQPEGYEPVVAVATKKLNDRIEVSVKDNGTGIPQKVLDKIFQPFFTTKPTGQGTGLGLSLSYDIVKAHNGELKLETREGEGTTFIISIPVN